jgi:hypothetical protein
MMAHAKVCCSTLNSARTDAFQEFLQSSLKPGPDFIPNESGFVHGVIRAYNDHHNLIIRYTSCP